MRIIFAMFIFDTILIGTCRIAKLIEERTGVRTGRKKAISIRKLLNIKTLYPHRDTSKPSAQHKKYPYLLKNMTIEKPDQVWTSDITYLPVGKGHFYLCCVMDWASREILGYSLSNTMDTDLCLKILEQIFSTARQPKVFNTDQGSQYTSEQWINTLESRGIIVSMDARGRWQDNVRMERFCRSYKYEHYFIHSNESLEEIRDDSAVWIEYYNTRRPHSKLDNMSPSIWLGDELFYQLLSASSISGGRGEKPAKSLLPQRNGELIGRVGAGAEACSNSCHFLCLSYGKHPHNCYIDDVRGERLRSSNRIPMAYASPW